MECPFHPTGHMEGHHITWNGYNSVPLHESDRHLTTFITLFGCWSYMRAPQSILFSGDGYNRCFNAVLAEFECKDRCVTVASMTGSTMIATWSSNGGGHSISLPVLAVQVLC